ncbi:hypothetical protein LCGC14_0469690 [marine sediment metagenome]|uniref:dihydrofolate reductase n=1 Tax=marine sediment metagenome TaxID=412755 RepID=A0A0F9SHU6_9ZZZZ
MQQVGMIVACDLNGLIGYDGLLPWTNKEDLRRFKELTMGGSLIMGRKTYDSLPIGKKSGKKLAGRLKYVLSSQASLKENNEETKWFKEWNKALLACPEDKPIWIIGGEEVYKFALDVNIPDFIEVTILNQITIPSIKDRLEVSISKSSRLPHIPYLYMVQSEEQNDKDTNLWHRRYIRRPGGFGTSFIEDIRKNVEELRNAKLERQV